MHAFSFKTWFYRLFFTILFVLLLFFLLNVFANKKVGFIFNKNGFSYFFFFSRFFIKTVGYFFVFCVVSFCGCLFWALLRMCYVCGIIYLGFSVRWFKGIKVPKRGKRIGENALINGFYIIKWCLCETWNGGYDEL